jgi:hypothetical protein
MPSLGFFIFEANTLSVISNAASTVADIPYKLNCANSALQFLERLVQTL